MTHITLIDAAIKSFVEAPRRTGGRIVYTKEQLRSLRFSPVVREWPPSFDRRFSRPNFCKNSYLHSQLNRSLYPKSFSRSDSNAVDNKKLLCLCDDAIVSTVINVRLDPGNDRDFSFYDKPTLLQPGPRNRQRDTKYQVSKPEWFTHGPRAVEEEVELSHADSPASYWLKTGEDEKENKSKIGTEGYKSLYQNDPSVVHLRSDNYTKDLLLKDCERIERPPNITTLREIESNLNIEPDNTYQNGDMSAYYKLLGLVGKSSPESLANVVGVDDSTPRCSDCRSTNNNQPHVSQCTMRHPAGELFNDPAVSEFVEKGYPIHALSSKEIIPKALRTKGKPEMPAQVACNPLTTSYQRQLMASGPLGQNALRWFKAMTNAAAASACINQRLDESAAHSCPMDLDEKHNEINPQVEENCNASGAGHQNVDSFARFAPADSPAQVSSDWQNDLAPDKLPQKIALDWPFYFSPSRYMVDSALSVGINLPLRHLKPPLFYYHPQMMQFLSRPMLHPLLLPHLLQRQFSFRNPALQLPFNYLRSQVMMQLPFDASCLTTFQSSAGIENPHESLLASQTSAHSSFSPLIQEVRPEDH